MYLYFSSVEQFDFSEMLDKTIKNYSPNDMKAEKKEEGNQETTAETHSTEQRGKNAAPRRFPEE